MVQPLFNKSFEKFTGFLTEISSDHNYIHQGLGLTAIINTGSISVAYDIAFKTPTVASGKYVHWRPAGITSSADYVDVQLTETETYTGGTTITPINRNRNSSTTSIMMSRLSLDAVMRLGPTGIS